MRHPVYTLKWRLDVEHNGKRGQAVHTSTRPTSPVSTAVHLFVGEKTKKDDAGGIGNFFEVLFTSDMRRGRAPLSPISTSSVSLYTPHVKL